MLVAFPWPPPTKIRLDGRRRAGYQEQGCWPSQGVTQSTFSPESVCLANVGQFAVCVDIATKAGFTSDHDAFTWKSMSDAVPASDSPALVQRLATSDKSTERREKLIKYVRAFILSWVFPRPYNLPGMERCSSDPR